MTRRLYYDDSHGLEFRARLTAVVPRDGACVGLVLDETLFYPTSGGQLHDHGTLGGRTIVDVIDADGRILHVVEGEAPVPGTELVGVIDADRRGHHRQQHSGQHVLSRIIEDHYDWPTLSSRLGETMNTLEIAAAEMAEDLLDEIEDRTNQTIWEGHPVQVRYLDPAEADCEGLRNKSGRDGPLRVIEVEGVDLCACGGTHVRNSAEIGLVTITGIERVRGGTRLHFLCGERAVQWRRQRVRWLEPGGAPADHGSGTRGGHRIAFAGREPRTQEAARLPGQGTRVRAGPRLACGSRTDRSGARRPAGPR